MRRNMSTKDMLEQRRKLRHQTPTAAHKGRKGALNPRNILNRDRMLADYGLNLNKYFTKPVTY